MPKSIQRDDTISAVQTFIESSTIGSSTPFFAMGEGSQPLISVGARPHVSQVPSSINPLENPCLVQSPAVSTIPEIISAYARVVNTTSSVDNHTHGMDSVDALSHHSLSSKRELIGSQTLEKTGSCNSGLDSFSAVTLSLNDSSSYGTMGGLSRSPVNTRLQQVWPGHILVSSPSLLTDSCTPQNGGPDFGIPLASTRDHNQVILHNGDDPEEIVTPLRLMRSYLLITSEGSMLDWSFSRGSTLTDLRHLLCGGWLLNELENLLCWSYEASARAIRQRQSARNDAWIDPYSTKPDVQDGNYKKLGTEMKLHRRSSDLPVEQTKLTSLWSSYMPIGTLNIGLRTVAPQHVILDKEESPSMLEISSIPIADHRTTGISAFFINPLAERQCPGISPQIRTFNVVSEGSEIIQCVQNNDLQGVQSLFDLGKASPSDVDPRGFSLLSASALPYSNLPPLSFTFLCPIPTFCCIWIGTFQN